MVSAAKDKYTISLKELRVLVEKTGFTKQRIPKCI